MLNLLPKGIIVGNIVDTLKKDPENGVLKLLETAKSHAKTREEQDMLTQVISYYATSMTAKMQVRNLVYNTSKKKLYAFAEKLYDAISTPPLVLSFMKMITIAQAAELKAGRQPIFPVIDLKNLNEASQEVLSNLKNEGHLFFTSIAVTEENIDIVTSDDIILSLVKLGVRAIFYRSTTGSPELMAKLHLKINQIRLNRPILAFFMEKKDPPNSTSLNYVITEHVKGHDYQIKLNLR